MENKLVQAAPPPAPTLFLTDADVAGLADWRHAFDALRSAYADAVPAQMVPPRSMARGDGLWLRGLTAVSPSERHMGSKLIAANLKSRHAAYLVSLFDCETMALAALIDGNRITGIRTAATAAVAVDAAAAPGALRVGVIGSGFEAKGLLTALSAVREIRDARVFSPSSTNRERFADDFKKLNMQIEPVASASDAVLDVDAVLCAARSRDESPVLLGEWLKAGTTVVSIGSTLPEQREVDVQVIERAALIIADMPDEVSHDTGDMLAARSAGIEFASKLRPLSDLVSGKIKRKSGDIVLYKSVGSALQDVVIAEMLLSEARKRGVGYELPQSIVPVAK